MFSEGGSGVPALSAAELSLINQWRLRWPAIVNAEVTAEAAIDLVDEVTQLHRQLGALPPAIATQVIREGMLLLVNLPSSNSPKPRPPQQDPWGLAAAQFLFDIIEWCRMQVVTSRSFENASPEERNRAVRDYLQANPNSSLRDVSTALKMSITSAQRTPAWRALAERRRQITASKPRAMSMTDELTALIASQQSDARSTRLHASERL